MKRKWLHDPTTSLSGSAYRFIEEQIVTLRLKPGDAINDAEVAEQLGVSRTPVREALLRLEDDGLVEVAPRRGIFVAPIDLLDHLDLLETRRQLDSLLMKFAVRRARAEHYENLRDCAGKMQQAAENKDTEEFLRQDRRFDAIVYEAARNHSAVAAVARLHSHCRRFWYAYQRETDLARSAAHHTAIMYAIASRDEKAAVGQSELLIDYLVDLSKDVVRREA
jgi:DNA-binding GntR family transcriptional regulator